jgi:hypothetical protein
MLTVNDENKTLRSKLKLSMCLLGFRFSFPKMQIFSLLPKSFFFFLAFCSMKSTFSMNKQTTVSFTFELFSFKSRKVSFIAKTNNTLKKIIITTNKTEHEHSFSFFSWVWVEGGGSYGIFRITGF